MTCEQSALDVEEMYLEEKVHSSTSEEPLAVDWSLVSYIPHRRPGRLHHVVADARLHSSSRENVELTIARFFGKPLLVWLQTWISLSR